jgi:hypothetical protein
MFGLAPKKDKDGNYAWTFPLGKAKLAGIAAEDIGKTAYGILKAGKKYIGSTVGIAGGMLSIEEMGNTLVKALGVSKVVYNAPEPDVYRGFGFPGADEYGNMFQVYRDFEKAVVGARSIDVTRELNPALESFEQFVNRQKDAILKAMAS